MKSIYMTLLISTATAIMLTTSQSALALASTNCGRIKQGIRADENALRLCRRGGGGCGWIEADIQKLTKAYRACEEGQPFSSRIYQDPGMRPAPRLRQYRR